MKRALRVLLLSRYDRTGPSSRIRQYQYLEALAAVGIEVTPAPLFADGFVARLYGGERREIPGLVRSFFRRLGDLARGRRFDLLWIEYEALPWVPFVLESRALGSGVPYVLELDDAVFHRYDLHSSGLVRTLLGRKIDALMRGAAVVIAGNAYLASRAERAGAGRIEVLPSAVDTEKYRPAPRQADEPFTVGWVGSPVTAGYLSQLEPVFHRLRSEGPARLVVIGGGAAVPASLEAWVEPWSEETEVPLLQTFDVGVMPLPDGPWERGKCGLKLVQYQACGLPVVASPVGVNAEIVQDGVNGFLATETDAWVEALSKLRAEPGLRHRMGAIGRTVALERFSTAVITPRLVACLSRAAETGTGTGARRSSSVTRLEDRESLGRAAPRTRNPREGPKPTLGAATGGRE